MSVVVAAIVIVLLLVAVVAFALLLPMLWPALHLWAGRLDNTFKHRVVLAFVVLAVAVCIIYTASFTCFCLNYFPGLGTCCTGPVLVALTRSSMAPPHGALQVNNLAINFGAWPATRSLTLLNLKGDMVKQKWRQQPTATAKWPSGQKAQKPTSWP